MESLQKKQPQIPNRRPTINQEVGCFIVSVSFDPETNKPIELWFSKRAKSGTELEQHLYDLGVAISKLMQNE
jgi:hypothetical protein